MADASVFIVVFLIFAAIAASVHSFIRRALDWMCPPVPPASSEFIWAATEREVWLDMVRKRKRRRLEVYREIDRDLQKAARRH
jgi:hypothetical protein